MMSPSVLRNVYVLILFLLVYLTCFREFEEELTLLAVQGNYIMVISHVL